MTKSGGARASVLGALAALVLAGCGPVSTSALPDLSTEERIDVVTTVGMLTDVVENVGGDRVRVEGLMGPGVDPHLYKASEGDVRRLERADAIFFVGLHLEAKMADVLERIGERRLSRACGEGIDESALRKPAAFDGQFDPHVWFDVALWRGCVEEVRDRLAESDPAHAALYRANAARYLAELTALDAEVRRTTATVPKRQRVLVTAHDAFGYFGRAYGFEVLGLQGISTAAEAGAKDVDALAAFIAARRIPAIFVESSVAPRTIEAVQQAVQARGFDVAIGGKLYADAMGSAGTPEGTYVGMVRHNVRTIVTALGGSAP
ncbi:MAG: metal ABC transporter solute-binding protein, Zn/Mn family [Gaiella sp.]